ncbi:glycosyltransferase family 2 protein [Polynucleobacter sp. MWH-P3-07-1]|uniref:glycosyltransferase family 2 protein n=1 Tax=Polynucleobacter sp. MWH-P3-07-1 TaxID=1743173 RepID=UPI001BFE315F|nr:glycosyltransferase [Polynucleobacter sp. MWH-P3-07-1]QWD83287.1 glycosyltransferase family 2 protein [Polynucleobacter sp. MWH-P3-07-1]QWD93051.1 glycosyltransferase family 2 protein [Polynucleobacter asymbioticus]
MASLDTNSLDQSITIGVSAYGNHETTKHCLRVILDGLKGNYELILVDDCSPDDGLITKLFIEAAKEHKNTKIYRFDENKEYSGSLNCILSESTGDKVFFVSNDIFISPSYVKALLEVADSSPNIGIVRGVSNFVDNCGKKTHNINIVDKIKHLGDVATFGEELFELEKNSYLEENFLTGDAFMTKREVITKIGTFDPLFYGYFADHDYGIRAMRAGFKLAVAKGAFAFHHRNSNFDYLEKNAREKKLNARWAKIYENWARFKLKYDLPIDRMYELDMLARMDWDSLNTHAKDCVKLYVPPVDYSKYLIAS